MADDKYGIFYMREEGDFLYYYVVCCICFFFVVIGAACCVGSCMFMSGSVSALAYVELALQQLEQMSAASEPKRNPPQDAYTRANQDPEASTTQAEDTFRDEFKGE